MSSSSYIKTAKLSAPKVGDFKNFYFNVGTNSFAGDAKRMIPQIKTTATDINSYFAPYQNQRPKIDHLYWKEGIEEAERPVLPYRVKMQEIYNGAIINGAVGSALDKRKKLILLKEYHIIDEAGETNQVATDSINKQWFRHALNYIVEAPAFGYTLIEFGDLVNGDFPKLKVVRRGWISPDREIVSSLPYIPSGLPFNDKNEKDSAGKSYYDFSLWVPTPSDIGISSCGYGYLYKAALYEVVLRNIIGWNSDFLEVFGQPLRHAKTSKTQEDEEYKQLENMMQQMGASAYLITDPADEIEFIESKGGTGSGWKSYDNLESRFTKVVNKIILGHPDAIDATPGKLGASQGGEKSPAQLAIEECESTDSRFVCDAINDTFLPKLRKFGFPIPLGHKFALKNDAEKQEIKEEKNKELIDASTWIKTMHDAGYKVKPEFIEKHTGVPVEASEEAPTEVLPPVDKNKKPPVENLPKDIKTKLKNIYKY